jgi:hypothetical protein
MAPARPAVAIWQRPFPGEDRKCRFGTVRTGLDPQQTFGESRNEARADKFDYIERF